MKEAAMEQILPNFARGFDGLALLDPNGNVLHYAAKERRDICRSSWTSKRIHLCM
jgi:hypothetical protein